MTTAADPWNDAGSVLEQAVEAQSSGDPELAYTFYARASELNPNGTQAWRGRAATTTLQEDALVSCAYAAALTPNDQALAGELGERVRASAMSAEPNSAASLVTIAQKLSEVGLIEEAHLLLRRANELDDTLEEGFVWTAATTDDLNEAATALKRALALNPRDARARAGFSTVMLKINAAGSITPTEIEAVTTEARASSLSDSTPELIRTGEEALAAGDKPLAYQAFVRATELAPREEAAWLGRARATSDIDETLFCLEQALAINPENMQAREARTFYRVRKLREGVRSRQEPSLEPPRFTPSFAGGGGFADEPSPEVRQRRILLLAIMIVLLLFFVLALLVRMQIIGR
jgi:tetratricopeptide (TPR) repeat protein